MREFRVRTAMWRVWMVPPPSGPEKPTNDFRDGWLCFEEDESARRWRMPYGQVPADWEQLSDIRLRELLITARKDAPSLVTTRRASEQRRKLEDAARAGV